MPKTRVKIGDGMYILVPDEWHFIERDRRFARNVKNAKELFAQKNREHNDGIRFGGARGAVVELIGCVLRLQKSVLHNTGQIDHKYVSNALMDALVYANIAMMMIEEDNIDGEPIVEEVDEDTSSNPD